MLYDIHLVSKTYCQLNTLEQYVYGSNQKLNQLKHSFISLILLGLDLPFLKVLYSVRLFLIRLSAHHVSPLTMSPRPIQPVSFESIYSPWLFPTLTLPSLNHQLQPHPIHATTTTAKYTHQTNPTTPLLTPNSKTHPVAAGPTALAGLDTIFPTPCAVAKSLFLPTQFANNVALQGIAKVLPALAQKESRKCRCPGRYNGRKTRRCKLG